MPPLKAELDEHLEKARELLTLSSLWMLVTDAENEFNRPAQSIGDLRVRRLIIQCCAALERNGMTKGKARPRSMRACAAVSRAGLVGGRHKALATSAAAPR
jgi:hypothetical protein